MKINSFLLQCIKNIKTILPYIFLILIYFFFVNLEARKDQKRIENNEELTIKKKETGKINKRIKIPVIPYIKQ